MNAPRLMRRLLAATWLALIALPGPARAAEVLVMLKLPTAHARVDGVYGGGGSGGSTYADAARDQAQRRIGERIARRHGFEPVSQWPMPTLGVDCFVMRLPPGADVAASLATLQAHPEVAWAQASNEFQAQGHLDPLYPLQPAASQWHLDELHARATGQGVRIALVDSGVDDAHPDLAGAIETRRNFVDGQALVPELHGTAVAGLIAARADNGIGMVGIAPGARLLALRACRELDAARTVCDTLSLAKALNFAIEQRAEVINMSLSGPFDRLLARLIDVAVARREQVVAAVDARAPGGGFPAGHPGVVAVAAADGMTTAPTVATPAATTDAMAPPGAWKAPARDLPTTVPGNGWRLVTGSSFAAGQVSGLLALLAQAGAASSTRLVRRADGGIDACASLQRSMPKNGDARACRDPQAPAEDMASR